MVGRLVEEQHIRLFEEYTTQSDTTALASRQCVDGGVTRRQAQSVHGDIKLAIEFPGASVVDPILQFGLLLDERVHLLVCGDVGELQVDLVEPLEEVSRFGDRELNVA